MRRIRYMLVVGDREQEQDEVSLREHRHGDSGSLPLAGFVERLSNEVETRLLR